MISFIPINKSKKTNDYKYQYEMRNIKILSIPPYKYISIYNLEKEKGIFSPFLYNKIKDNDILKFTYFNNILKKRT
jgi:hypothetical protein